MFDLKVRHARQAGKPARGATAQPCPPRGAAKGSASSAVLPSIRPLEPGATPVSGAMRASDDSTSQLIQTMTDFGDAGAGDSLNPAFGTEALQQQQFLTTPRMRAARMTVHH